MSIKYINTFSSNFAINYSIYRSKMRVTIQKNALLVMNALLLSTISSYLNNLGLDWVVPVCCYFSCCRRAV